MRRPAKNTQVVGDPDVTQVRRLQGIDAAPQA
jgi:hypothetical protein